MREGWSPRFNSSDARPVIINLGQARMHDAHPFGQKGCFLRNKGVSDCSQPGGIIITLRGQVTVIYLTSRLAWSNSTSAQTMKSPITHARFPSSFRLPLFSCGQLKIIPTTRFLIGQRNVNSGPQLEHGANNIREWNMHYITASGRTVLPASVMYRYLLYEVHRVQDSIQYGVGGLWYTSFPAILAPSSSTASKQRDKATVDLQLSRRPAGNQKPAFSGETRLG